MAVTLTQLLQAMVQMKGGSDLHLAVRSQPMVRVRGDMVKLNVPALTEQDLEAMINEACTPEQKAELLKEKSIDFSIKRSGIGIFRVNIFTQRHGLSIVLRILTEAPPRLADINAPSICETACSYANGLVLICGPTGSGKSTTLAAMINYINETTPGHILTLEDPIEFMHETKKCMVNQRSLGAHFTTFSSALRAALREDPDVILIGEMRDLETISLALKAAETGHLVFGTLHTNSANKTIDRIIGSFPAEEQPQIRGMLAESLRVVIAQKLVPTADKTRRVCLHDILVNNHAVANLIREGKTYQIPSIMQTGKREGMQILDNVLLENVQSKVITGEDAWEHANDKKLFEKFAPKAEAPASTSISAPAQGGIPRPAAAPPSAGAAPGSPGRIPGSVPGAPVAGSAVPGAPTVKPIVRKAG